MYLGLVLAGATPQVLAQAAMSRQFDVKDEVEVKDDLDKKPDNLLAKIAESAASEIDHKITRSVGQFFAKFKSVDSVGSLNSSSDTRLTNRVRQRQICTGSRTYYLNGDTALRQILTITNLPRAGLDSLLASDAM